MGLASTSVSRRARILRLTSATLAVVGIALLVLWFAIGGKSDSGASASGSDGSGSATSAPSVDTAPSAQPDPSATPAATATPTPSPTPIPTPLPFAEAVSLGASGDALSTPLPDCGLVRDEEVVAGTVTLRCIEDWAAVPVVAAAPGRIVDVVANEVVDLADVPLDSGAWSWAEQTRLGAHVVVDHGPLPGSTNTQTVYAGLASIADGISVGTVVDAGTELGVVAGPHAALRFSVWTDNVRQDGARALEEAPPIDVQRAAAEALRGVIASPIEDRCPLVLNAGSLPGAPRDYRNGTHRGIDFGCGAADRSVFSIADGTVVYLVDDYADPSVPEREALLQNAAQTAFTPHWTLNMLYGNVVVIDHGDIPGAGRVVTISAHLESVDPSVTLGATVTRGQRIGEAGNRGTNASAQGIRGASDPTLHLHWELFIDNWYLGAGLSTGETVEVMTTALCGAAQTPGCPA